MRRGHRILFVLPATVLVLGLVAVAFSAKKADSKKDAPVEIDPNAPPAKPNAPAEPEGMKPMFNGKDLTGWEGDPRLWRFENGTVIGQTTMENPAFGNTFLIWRAGEAKDFELRFSFKIHSGNSGVQYRSKQVESKDPKNKWVISGYQAEINDQPGHVGFLYHEKGPGHGYADKKNYLCRVADKVILDEKGVSNVVGSLGDFKAICAAYKKTDWNDYIIIAKGNHLMQFINGVQTIDLTDNDEKNRAMSGLLALQIHQGQPMMVEFKNMRIKQD